MMHSHCHDTRKVGKDDVLILVVMDDALVLFEQIENLENDESLNPCFNG